MALRIKDGRDKFYSFDTNRILILEDDDGSVSHVDFETDGNKSISKAVNTDEDGTRYVEVPNDFFDGTYSRIVAYYVSIDDSGQYTQNKQTFRVTYRQEYEGYTIDDEDDRITIANAIKLTDDAKREAEGHAETARKWAVGAGAVEGTLFSAKHYAGEADAILSTIIDIKIALETYVGSNVEGEESGVYLEIAQKLSNAIEAIRNAMEDEDNGALAQISARAKQILDDLDERLGTSADLTDATILGAINKARGTALEDIKDAVGSDSKYGSALYKIAFALRGALSDISDASGEFSTQSSQASEALEIAKQGALTSINGQVESAINTKLPAKVDHYVGTPDDSPETNTVMGAINKKMVDIDEKATGYLQDLENAKDDVYTEFGESLGQLTSSLTDLSNDTYRKAEVDEKVADATPSDYASLKNKVTNLEYENRIVSAVIKKKIAEETTMGGEVINFPVVGDYPLADWGLLKRMRGKTWAWNQIIDDATPSTLNTQYITKSGYTYTVSFSGNSSTLIALRKYAKVTKGHKFLVKLSSPLKASGTSLQIRGIDDAPWTDSSMEITAITAGGSEAICTCDYEYMMLRYFVGASCPSESVTFTLSVTDLTVLGLGDVTSVSDSRLDGVKKWLEAHPQYVPVGGLYNSVYESGVSVGKNLFDNNLLLLANGWQKDSNGYFHGIIESWRNKFLDEPFVNNPKSSRLQISLDAYCNGGTPRILVQYTDGTSYVHYIHATSPTHYDFITAEGKTVSEIIADYGTGASNTLYIKNMMVCENSSGVVRSYTTHFESTLDLSFLNSVEDIGIEGTLIDFEKETVTWNWGKYTFTGSESWGYSSTYKRFSTSKPVDAKPSTTAYIFGGYERSTDIWVAYGKDMISLLTNSELLVRDTRYESASAFNDYMVGKHIVYELATPITKTFEELGITIPSSWDGGKPWIRVEAGGSFHLVSSGAPAKATVSFLTDLGGN